MMLTDIGGPMVAVSAAMIRIEEEMRQAARSDAKILLTGESGVGKEVVARLIQIGRAHV